MDDGKPPVKVDGYPERVIHVGSLLGTGFELKESGPKSLKQSGRPMTVQSDESRVFS